MRIIVADDDLEVRQLVLRILRPMGHECAAAAGVRELAALCLECPPDLIISDVGMDDGDGIHECLELGRAYPRTAFIMMTGDPEHAKRAILQGFRWVLHKPFEVALFRAILKECLDGR